MKTLAAFSRANVPAVTLAEQTIKPDYICHSVPPNGIEKLMFALR
jgi:hypothetical protein